MTETRNGIELGDKVTDNVTGFTGVVTGLADYLTGCSQACVQPILKDDADWKEARWFDVDRLTITELKAVVHVVKTARGGPSGSAPTK
jgi:hypothetical protein